MSAETPSEPLMVFQDQGLKQTGIGHGFFARRGGVSGGLYSSLNCGNGSDDSASNVVKNQTLVADYLGVSPDTLLTLYQIHSDKTVTVTDPWLPAERPQADAMVTNTPGLAIGVLTADCAPVLFADETRGVIAAAHAGWQGALSGVVEQTITAMCALGAERGSIIAVVGPCIGQHNYQVGPEFRDTFLSANRRYESLFAPSPDETRPDHWQFDLRGFVEGRLHESGLHAVSSIAMCSYANPDKFFSYRRATHHGEADYGRNISAIAMTDE